MGDEDDVEVFRFRRLADPLNPGRLQRPAEENANFQKALLRPNEEIGALAGEHDGFVGSVNPLIAECGSRLAQTFPSIAQVFGEMPRQRGFRSAPAVMRFAFFDWLLAVETNSACHIEILPQRRTAQSDQTPRVSIFSTMVNNSERHAKVFNQRCGMAL